MTMELDLDNWQLGATLLPYNYGKVNQLDTGQSVAMQADEWNLSYVG